VISFGGIFASDPNPVSVAMSCSISMMQNLRRGAGRGQRGNLRSPGAAA
jgi:hypothetical protein